MQSPLSAGCLFFIVFTSLVHGTVSQAVTHLQTPTVSPGYPLGMLVTTSSNLREAGLGLGTTAEKEGRQRWVGAKVEVGGESEGSK